MQNPIAPVRQPLEPPRTDEPLSGRSATVHRLAQSFIYIRPDLIRQLKGDAAAAVALTGIIDHLPSHEPQGAVSVQDVANYTGLDQRQVWEAVERLSLHGFLKIREAVGDGDAVDVGVLYTPAYDPLPPEHDRVAPSMQPVDTAVYRLYDAADDLLYVGITTNPDRRFDQHSKTKLWFAQVARNTVEWHPNRRAALDAERAAIASEQPRHNNLKTLR